jgi:trehalose/maltose hydrolase-like predicted phosphorylase
MSVMLLTTVVVASAVHAQLPPSPSTGLPVPPSSRDADWAQPFGRADLLYHPGPRPDFENLPPIERCGPTAEENTNCTALWWPGLGNGFLGGIAQGPTLRIAGYTSGFYPKNGTETPTPYHGFSEKEFSARASIPAYGSSIIAGGPSLLSNSSRAALNTREAVYYERSPVAGGGKLELRTYFHRTRRNLIVVDVELDCTACTKSAQVSLRSFARSEVGDVVFQHRGGGAAHEAGTAAGRSPRQLIGALRTPENCMPSVSGLYDTNHTLGYVYDICPAKLTAASGERATLQLLSVLTLSSEHTSTATPAVKEAVVSRAMKIYEDAKRTAPAQLLLEHRQGWAALWKSGGIELATNDLALQQTTNATFYYLLMSTRPDWLHSTLVPSTIAASAPYPHGYYGAVFWDQDTFQAPPLMVFHPPIARNLLQNRLFQLPSYKSNAKAFGLKGAYVPWEVGYSGGFARDDEVNHREVHVAGDVALFIKQYCQLTQNSSELRELFPLLEGISDFVVSRVNRTDEHGWLSVENIVAPDESTGLNDVNNDVYTNAVGVLALETTLDAVASLGDSVSVSQEQLASWRHAAAKLKLQLVRSTPV